MDAEEYGSIFGVEGLSYAVEERAAGAQGEEAIEAAEKVSLSDVMGTLEKPIQASGDITPEETRALQRRANDILIFGPGSNKDFVRSFAHEDPLLSQFVVGSVNAGLFRGEIQHELSSMVVQLLTYFRYGMRDAFPPNNQSKFDTVISYSMAELLGPFIPPNRRLEQAAARKEVIEAVLWAVANEDGSMTNVIGNAEEWFSPLIGSWDTLNDLVRADTITINEALALLMVWASFKKNTKDWLNNANLFSNTVTAICKRGTLTDDIQRKIQDGMNEDLNIATTYIRPSTCKMFYRNYGKYINADNADRLFTHLRSLIPDICLRLILTIQQATGSGLTVYFLIRRAMIEFPSFNWAGAYFKLESDFGAYSAAAARVGNNGFYGFNVDLQLVKSTNYKSLGYLAWKLCILAGGDQKLREYGGFQGVIKNKPWIEEQVRQYVANQEGDVIPQNRVQEYRDRVDALLNLIVANEN